MRLPPAESGLAKALSDRDVRTARGGAWTAVQAGDILART